MFVLNNIVGFTIVLKGLIVFSTLIFGSAHRNRIMFKIFPIPITLHNIFTGSIREWKLPKIPQWKLIVHCPHNPALNPMNTTLGNPNAGSLNVIGVPKRVDRS